MRAPADRAHPAHVPAGAGDDAEQREALQGQVVETVAAAQGERGVEFGAGAAQVVAFEAGAAPAQMGQRLQLRFGGQLGDLRDHERGRVGGPVPALVGAELLGDGTQHREAESPAYGCQVEGRRGEPRTSHDLRHHIGAQCRGVSMPDDEFTVSAELQRRVDPGGGYGGRARRPPPARPRVRCRGGSVAGRRAIPARAWPKLNSRNSVPRVDGA